MLIKALFKIAKKYHQPKCPSRDEWIHTMESNHTLEYLLAIKKNEVLTHATTWMSLENMLSERSQSQKTTYYMIPFI